MVLCKLNARAGSNKLLKREDLLGTDVIQEGGMTVNYHGPHPQVIDTGDQLQRHADELLQGGKGAVINTGSLTLKSIQMLQIAFSSAKIKKVTLLQTEANKRFVHNRQTSRI